MKSIREKNKEQDFRDLENAVRHMQDYLRSDEAHPDLYDQFPFRTDIGGCHRYYLEPYRSTFGSMLEKGPFIPFPSEIMQKYERVECASFMGIIPEINRVWITIDNQLYLWNYYQPEDYQVYDGITEVIVSVALTVPKPGIFLDSVKYLLVVATPVDIVLLAICADDAFDQIKIVPTAYTLPSDNITMIKIVGSELGRIFMIGNDKNLYELDYTISESTWAPILGTGPQRKCAKINHFAWNWKLNSIIPPIFRSQRDLLDEFTDICLDNSRNIVYTITLGGELNGFYLYQPSPTPSNSTSGTPSSSSSPSSNIDFFLNSFNLFDECRRYCTSSRFAPQSSPHASLFNDPFSSDGFIPIAMYPIPFTESKKAHLLVILKNGIRIYLSLIFYRYEVDHSPRGIEVSYIRNPPSPEILDVASNPTLPPTADVENGSLPSLHLNRQLSLGKTFASKGVFLFAVEKNQQPDELFGIFEDSMKRDHSVATNTTHHHASQSFSLKEGISYALGSNVSGAKVYDMKEVSTKYYNYSLSKLKSLFYQSSSPSDMNIRDQTHHHYPNIIQHAGGQSRGGAGWLGSFFADKTPGNDDDDMNREVSAVLTDSNALVLRSVATRAGVERIDAQNLAMLSEQAAQHLPTHSYCTQRQILVLTSNGLQVLLKLRPADILFRCLIQHDSRTDDYVREFFTTYGSLPASLMCLGLALGLPVDACGSRFVNPIQPLEFAPTVPLKTIQVRAMRAMFALNPGPSYRAALPSVTGGALHTAADNRVVVVGNTHEFQKSISHDAFYWMASRLLRPIWFRAIFDPRTEELLSDVWSLFLLQELRKPIEYLVELLVTYYPSAISSPVDQAQSSSSVSQAAKMMEGLDATNGSTTFITQQIAEQARQHHPNLEKSLFQRAKQLEDSSIRNLYLLLTRVLQGFSVLDIFVRSIEDWKLPHAILKELISSLKGYSFRSLVLLPKIQDICKKQLYHLITHLLTSNKIELAEIILEQLKEQGYYYFSSGDVYYIEGNKLFTLLKMKSILPDYQGYFSTGSTVLLASTSSTSSSSEIMKYVEQCCDYYLKASEFWNSIENLSNTNNESELKQTCNALLFLGRLGWESIVNICLSTASKFSSIQSADTYQLSNKQYSKHHQLFPTSPVPTSATALTTVNDGNSVTTKESLTLMRDFHLFHGGMMLSETMKQDYQRHCYEILIDQILFTETNLHSVYDFHQYQQLPNNYAEQISQFLLTYSLQKCSDLRYHELLYSKLYSMKEKGHQHRLLSITSPYIEQFLRERDPELLYVYYMSTEFPRSPEYLKAIDLMCGIASDPSELPIEYRIECIEKALTSAMIAYQTLTNQSSSVSNSIGNKTMFTATQSLESYLLDNIQQFKDMIAVAKYQERIGKSLLQDYERYGTVDEASSLRDRYDEKTLRELDIMKEFIHQLQFQLVNLTTLYEIAFRYRMWEFNLLILQLSKQTDVELIQKLWKSYIYRMVPLKARYSEVVQFLDSQRRDTSKLIIDPRNQESRYQFEEYTLWLPNLFQQVLGLGKEILSHENKLLPNKSAADTASNYLLESSVYFPIITVIEEMEEILSYIRIPSISSTSNSSSQLFGSSSAAATEEKESIVPIQLLQEFRQHYSFGYQLIHHLQLSSSIIIEYYLQIFLRWKSKTYDKLLQLLMIIIYLLLEWIRTSNEEVNNNQYTEDNWYCITMIRQGKLDKWLEILRSQLLSIQYRQIKESFSPFIEQLMTEMNQIQKYKETLTIYTKITK